MGIKSAGLVTGGMYNNTGAMGGGWCSAFSLPHCHHHGPQGNDPYPAEGQPGCPHQTSPPKFSKCDADAQPPHNDFQADKYSYSGNTVTARGVSGIQQATLGIHTGVRGVTSESSSARAESMIRPWHR